MQEGLALGTVIRVHSYRGEEESFEGEIIAIRDAHDLPIKRSSHKARRLTRSRWLLTLKAKDGTTKSYYHAFCKFEIVNAK